MVEEDNWLKNLNWKHKDEYIWSDLNKNLNTNISVILKGYKKEKIDDKVKMKEEIVIKIIKMKFEMYPNYLEILRELMFLMSLKNKILNRYFTQLYDIVLPPKDNFNYLYLIFRSDGCSLLEYIAADKDDKEKIQYKQARKWIIFQIIYEIYLLHSFGIIHQDVKPQNILIDSKAKVKICDFGMSIKKKSLENPSINDGKKGTRVYMAPEYLINSSVKLYFDEKIDIWAIGVIMIEIFTESKFFFRDKENEGNKSLSNEICIMQLKYIFKKLGINFNNKKNEFWNNEFEVFNFIYNNKHNKIDFVKVLSDYEGGRDLINDKDALDLLKGLLKINPNERFSAKEALNSNYCKQYINFTLKEVPKIFVDTSFEEEFFKLKDENKKKIFFINKLKEFCSKFHS